RRLLVDLLEGEGYEARSAADGLEALAECERELPRLLITDLQMPNMDGAELVAELERRRLGTFPVIVVSGRHDLMQRAEFASHLEPKPVNIERFMRRVRDLVPPISSSGWSGPVTTGASAAV